MAVTHMTNPLPLRQLGQSGLSVSAIGLGCMGMSDFYGPSDTATNLAVLHHAIDLGVNFFDTADMYGVGRNEELLSQVLQSRRSEVVLATKFGIVRAPNGDVLGIDGRPEYVAAACDASLKRLGVDQIDLYYQHRVDPKVPIEDTVGAMAQLIAVGKVRHLGLSEAGPETLRRATRIHPIAALQSEYSLWTRNVAAEMLPVTRECGTAFVAYAPLGRGFLTGSIAQLDDLAHNDWRRNNPRFQAENFAVNQALVAAIVAVANEKHCTPAQLALAWLLHQGKDIVPIAGTRRIERLDENCAATQVQLTAQDLERIESILVNTEISGSRYPAQAMAMLGR